MIEEFFKYTKTEEIALKECNKIEKVRSRLYCLGLIGTHCNGTCFGNISLRYKKKDSFVITGTRTGDHPKLNPSYYSLVKKIDFKKPMIYSIGPSTPSIQSGLHAAIYSIDSDINAVIYVYNEKMVEYMMDNDYLCVNNTTHDYFRREDIVSDVKSLYSNVDPFLNNTFVITGDLEGVAVFGKNLAEAEKSLYSIIHKVLKRFSSK